MTQSAKNKVSQGVTLLAFGKPIFFEFAFNMALSLRKHSPKLQIQLICDQYIKEIGDRSKIFDIITPLSHSDFTENGRVQAGKAKLSMYKYFHFDETIFLDVDGVLLQDITPLLSQQDDFKIQRDVMHWIDDHQAAGEKYDFDGDVVGCNSSIMFIRKSASTEKLFADALMAMSQPIEKASRSWFENMHPDELYLGISMVMNNTKNVYFDPVYPVYFRRRIDYKTTGTLSDVKTNHFVVGVYGNHRYNHASVYDLYQRENRANWKQMIGMSPRKDIHKLMRYKH